MKLLAALLAAAAAAAGSRVREAAPPGFVVEYFVGKGVVAVTSGLCGGGEERAPLPQVRTIHSVAEENNIRLFKEFSKRKIGFDRVDVERLNETEVVRRLTSGLLKLGVLLDLACPGTMDLLKTANDNDLFSVSNSLAFWLIFAEAHVSKESLESLAESQAPEVRDPVEYLTKAYEDGKNEKYLMKINRAVNEKFLRTYERPRGPAQKRGKVPANETQVADVLKMKILLDNEMALAVPDSPGGEHSYALYALRKATEDSAPKIYESARVGGDGRLQPRSPWKRNDLGNAVLRAASVMLQPEAFTSIDDLATREADVWPKMSYPHVQLLAEDFNFRLVTRFFDDYGWQKNGTFSHLIGLLQRKKADLSAAALLMRPDRFAAVDFLDCPFRLQTGVLFREPPLSSVANVFLLPFSRAAWICVGVVVVLAVAALRCRVVAGRTLLPADENLSDYYDVADYVVGAICQQGSANTPDSPSARTATLVILLTSLVLFTSYSACIVALLQSSSSAISTVADVTRSDFEVAIQTNFPLYKVLIQEAAHPVLKEFYARKVLPKGKKAFCDRREGIERMRTGMFAFEVELTAAYKQIAETYEESEKCGIREIDLVPTPFICMSVPKGSPYGEAFAERLAWQRETGLFDRSRKLWLDQKPRCEVGRIGYASVGLAEFGPALRVFACGVLAAALVLFAELLRRKKNTKRPVERRLVKKRVPAGTRRDRKLARSTVTNFPGFRPE